ncbi:DNA/RNA helicase domain-containing protein [uncultured Methanobrevibacter sp.]|uniref:DNA/RNA helicase domain-containing protein n=1 Tax=uncultured Methanobrevibacter sp. TaxID=253161 RepID=UPI00260ABCC4|nr:DNA/RNA helicase domain-containing protein [uncultured Methanobrevibacter sp.]
MVRSGYEKSIREFLDESTDAIFGEIDRNSKFQATKKQQKNAWISQINILKEQLTCFSEGNILFEYDIPRMGSYIDNVLLINGLIFVIEFKVGEDKYNPHIPQLKRYVKLLKNFHNESEDKLIIPILIATEAENYQNTIRKNNENIFDIIKANKHNLSEIITPIINDFKNEQDLSNWSNSKYKPTPTILDAARTIYSNHETDISKFSSEELFLNETEQTIDDIIDDSKKLNKKSIIFITGVPGAGKTLIGLNTATKRTINNDENAVLLSGNDSLVEVLWEALARDHYDRNEENYKRNKISKHNAIDDAKTKVKSFIQKLHEFRKDAINDERVQHEQIVIFDEAQRAWTQKRTEKFMKERESEKYLGMSEPEFLISIMDRREDWAVIICLVGQGQEINTGEAGINEWFESLEKTYPHWNVYAAKEHLNQTKKYDNLTIIDKEYLNLYTTIRSLDAPNLPNFIEDLLKNDKKNEKEKLKEVNEEYALYITRNLKDAKKWIKQQITEYDNPSLIRTGLLAHSNALRLIPEGIFVKALKCHDRDKYKHIANWFLNEPTDIRSSNYLEIPATQFDIQGLEIDYSIMCWDANLRYINGDFRYHKFKGSKWEQIKQENAQNYLLNTYRVLLTRARRGMVIFVPEGDEEDQTRKKEYYDGTYEYLKSIGIKVLSLENNENIK